MPATAVLASSLISGGMAATSPKRAVGSMAAPYSSSYGGDGAHQLRP
jgi:hypothetical protein